MGNVCSNMTGHESGTQCQRSRCSLESVAVRICCFLVVSFLPVCLFSSPFPLG